MFTLINPRGRMAMKLRVVDSERAVHQFFGLGPMFGHGSDLYLGDLSDTGEVSHVWLESYKSEEVADGCDDGKCVSWRGQVQVSNKRG